LPANSPEDYWLLMQSKPLKEKFLTALLERSGFEIYCPHYPVKPVNPRARKWKPFYPGYLFVHAANDLEDLSRLRWIPGSLGLVMFGEEPALVPAGVLAGIRRKVEQMFPALNATAPDFRPGEPVRVIEGPFRGYEGIFNARLSGSDRARVLLGFLQTQQKNLIIPTRFLQLKNQP
jgi:transcription antitermination factor NusG